MILVMFSFIHVLSTSSGTRTRYLSLCFIYGELFNNKKRNRSRRKTVDKTGLLLLDLKLAPVALLSANLSKTIFIVVQFMLLPQRSTMRLSVRKKIADLFTRTKVV